MAKNEMYYPSLGEIKTLTSVGNLAPVYREINADLETPVSIGQNHTQNDGLPSQKKLLKNVSI